MNELKDMIMESIQEAPNEKTKALLMRLYLLEDYYEENLEK